LSYSLDAELRWKTLLWPATSSTEQSEASQQQGYTDSGISEGTHRANPCVVRKIW